MSRPLRATRVRARRVQIPLEMVYVSSMYIMRTTTRTVIEVETERGGRVAHQDLPGFILRNVEISKRSLHCFLGRGKDGFEVRIVDAEHHLAEEFVSHLVLDPGRW